MALWEVHESADDFATVGIPVIMTAVNAAVGGALSLPVCSPAAAAVRDVMTLELARVLGGGRGFLRLWGA